nr:ORF94 [Acipenserid herpesvirus 1]
MPPKTLKKGPHKCPLCGFTTEHLGAHLRRGHKDDGLSSTERQRLLSEQKHGRGQKCCPKCGIHVKRLDKHNSNCPGVSINFLFKFKCRSNTNLIQVA